MREAANVVVTPYAPYILCDYYLSSEIQREAVTWLNPAARPLSKGRIRALQGGEVLFVQVDQLTEFARRFLPRARAPFVLITGKWHLPGLRLTRDVHRILESPLLLAWYSQNQVYEDIPIEPFPYGVHLETAPEILTRMESAVPTSQRAGVLVPFSTVHEHLLDAPRAIRESLKESMAPRVPFSEYLDNVSRSQIVVCPPGDRPDTYRHWETVALGAIPASSITPLFRQLFGNSILLVDNLVEIAQRGWSEPLPEPQPQIATLGYWRGKLGRAQSPTSQ